MGTVKLAVAAVLVLVWTPSVTAQSCRNWIEVVAGSFIPKTVDHEALRQIATLSPDQYFRVTQEHEERTLLQIAQSQNRVTNPATVFATETQLRNALTRFYDIGFQLYGVRLDPQNMGIAPGMDVNAFATGSRLFMNEGLLQYFLQPQGYVVSMIAPGGRYTVEQYNWVRSNFPWQQDWNSIYFVLAHESAHNLMRHRDEALLEHVRGLFGDYRQAAVDHRKDVAHGRTGGGVKRYLWQSLQNIAAAFQDADKKRARESEADVIALVLLQRSGFDPGISLIAAERMMAILGGGPTFRGWQGAVTEVMCSTHPDWIVRRQTMQQNVNCLRFTGKPCQNHIAYPVETLLSDLQKGLSQLDEYNEQTVEIAKQAPNASSATFEVKIEVEPKDAQLLIDNQFASSGKVVLPPGPHKLSASREGYEPSELAIVVFPDVQPKVKMKLKKLKR